VSARAEHAEELRGLSSVRRGGAAHGVDALVRKGQHLGLPDEIGDIRFGGRLPEALERVDRPVDDDDVAVGSNLGGQRGDELGVRADDDDDVARRAQRRKNVKSR
jgi:hypothetical protein